MEKNEIKLGEFIKANYKRYPIFGIVVEIKKDILIINFCTPIYNEEKNSYSDYRIEKNLVNISKKNIIQIGLNENETILN
jgi:hypothetical protein